jgi:hypothetical protein
MTCSVVYLLTATYPDGRSLILGVYATKELAYMRSEEVRVNGSFPENVDLFVTETDVIGA